MSAKVGQIYFAREKRNQFLNIPTEGAVEYSEATAELIDSEVREIINNQYKRTMEILLQMRDILDTGAKILLEKEKIEGDEQDGGQPCVWVPSGAAIHEHHRRPPAFLLPDRDKCWCRPYLSAKYP